MKYEEHDKIEKLKREIEKLKRELQEYKWYVQKLEIEATKLSENIYPIQRLITARRGKERKKRGLNNYETENLYR